jgi:hypothetical protein
MGKFVGALTGISAGMRDPGSGAFAARQITRAPYEEALQRYKQQVAQTGQAAVLEREDIENQIRGLTQARALGLRYDEFKLKQLENQQRDDIAQGNLGVARGRAKDYGRSIDVAEAGQKQTVARDTARLGIDKGRLADAQRRTNIMMQDAGTRAAAQKSLDTYHTSMSDTAKKRAQTYADREKLQAPYQKAKALQTALLLLQADPRYKDYVDENVNGVFSPKESDGSAKYELFRKELERFVNTGISDKGLFPDENDDDDFENMFEIKR